MKLACKICGAVLTADLAPLANESLLSKTDGEPRIPKGFFHIVEADSGFEKEGTFVVNLEDLDGADLARDGRKCSGCCGVDGCDGLNLVCPAGHDVATERSDCWMPHRAVFESSLVILKE